MKATSIWFLLITQFKMLSVIITVNETGKFHLICGWIFVWWQVRYIVYVLWSSTISCADLKETAGRSDHLKLFQLCSNFWETHEDGSRSYSYCKLVLLHSTNLYWIHCLYARHVYICGSRVRKSKQSLLSGSYICYRKQISNWTNKFVIN